MNLDKVKQRYSQAEKEYYMVLQRKASIYRVCIPGKDTWYNYQKGQRKEIYVYNSAPSESNYKHAKLLLSLVIPNDFFSLFDPSATEEQETEYSRTLRQLTDKLDKYFQVSNFKTACGESFIDLGAGTGGIYVRAGDKDKPFTFHSLDMARLKFLESSNHRLDNVFHDVIDLNIDVACEMYPKADFSCYKESDSAKITFKEAVCWDEDDKKYYHTLYDNDKELYCNELDYNPFIIFRYDKKPNEWTGYGVLDRQLGSILSANDMMRLVILNAEYTSTSPIVAASGSLINQNTSFEPDAIIEVNPGLGLTPAQAITRLPMGGAPLQLDNLIAIINKQIDDAFIINQLQYDGSPKTATEIQAIIKQRDDLLGAVYTRLQDELLDPVLDCALKICQKLGVLPKLIDVNTNKPIKHKFFYKSPLDNLRQENQLLSLQRYAQTVGQIQGLQMLQMSLNGSAIPEYIAKMLNIDPKLIKTSDEIQAEFAKLAKNAQLAQQQQQLQLYNQQNVLPGQYGGASA